MSGLAVKTQGLCRRYGRRWALVNLDLELPAGKRVLLAGRNGAGKTTLLKVLGSALKADQGLVEVLGHRLPSQRYALRRRLALLSHRGYGYEAFSALQNLQVVARLMGRASDRDTLLPYLEEVDLAPRADDALHTFSAGMRKRLSLARTLLQTPELVLLDEPYGALDVPGFALVDRVIDRLQAQGATVLLATHLIERSAPRCDVGVLLESGGLVWQGPAAELPERWEENAA